MIILFIGLMFYTLLMLLALVPQRNEDWWTSSCNTCKIIKDNPSPSSGVFLFEGQLALYADSA
jgi:hypothetical protein